MLYGIWNLAAAAVLARVVRAQTSPSLASVCTALYARSVLPMQDLHLDDGVYTSIAINASSIVAAPGYNYSVSNNVMYPNAEFDYCQINFSYSHVGRSDRVQVLYWLPAPSAFKNRYLTTGEGGLAINSGTTSLPGGVQYGVVAGITDGRFGAFTTSYDAVSLLANGTLNNDELYMFGYQAIHETAWEATSYEGVTYDTLRDWMYLGWQRYDSVLQTTWPDLTPYHASGGKVLHYHGESDYSIPTASSVHYWESVRKIMYSNMTYNVSVAALNDWYRLYLVPGGSHCTTNTAEPNGPWPQTSMGVMIDWAEYGIITPTTLNATHLTGADVGSNAQICAWPLRPLWAGNGTSIKCVFDQESIDTWLYDFDSFPMPVY